MAIVEAVGVSANLSATGTAFPLLGKKATQMIEQAMSAAVTKCYEAGITDPEKVREAMHTARMLAKSDLLKIEEKLREEYKAAQEKAAATPAPTPEPAPQEVTSAGNPEG